MHSNNIFFKNGADKFRIFSLHDIKTYINKYGEVRFIDTIKKVTKEIRGAELNIVYDRKYVEDVHIDDDNDFWKACKHECKVAAEILKKDKCSRQAVVDFMTISPVKLPSCFVCAQFFVSNDNIDMFVYMRSCDALKKLESDLARYCIMNNVVADYLELKPRNITIYIGSLHIYVEDMLKQ